MRDEYMGYSIIVIVIEKISISHSARWEKSLEITQRAIKRNLFWLSFKIAVQINIPNNKANFLNFLFLSRQKFSNSAKFVLKWKFSNSAKSPSLDLNRLQCVQSVKFLYNNKAFLKILFISQ